MSAAGGRRAVTLALSLAAGMTAGCAGNERTILTGGPTVGQLKTSLSHVEFENEQLKKSVAKLERENRSMEDRLVQEQINGGDLAARLDDARNLLRDRGVDADLRVGSRRQTEGRNDSAAADSDSRARTIARPARPRRKPPFAQISGQVDALPSAAPPDGTDTEESGGVDGRRRSRRAGARFDDDLDHHSFETSPLRWLPVADATGAPTAASR